MQKALIHTAIRGAGGMSARYEIERHDARDSGRSGVQEQVGNCAIVRGVPHAALRDTVAGYVGYRTLSPGPVFRQLFPRGWVTVLFGPPLPNGLIVPVTGVHDRVVRFTQQGRHRGIAVGLAPTAAFALLGVEMFELGNRQADLVDFLGTAVSEVIERLAEAADWRSRFLTLDQFLLSTLEPRPVRDDLVGYAWQCLQHAYGTMSITLLAEQLDVSTRTLELRFRREVGVSPKNAARILRFQHAVRLLEHSDQDRMTSIAHACGYADHAHFAHEVRAMTACTPTQLRAALRPHPRAALLIGTRDQPPTRDDRLGSDVGPG
ncbi:helix-turn-helix domain-containing protein [Nocardia sp. NPDC006044]|uniref:AraC family transcriptional regulator n=1 Tax=Nocardia sp. NPDC006044 TaxID=3364306 RepID=UPI0036825429